MRSSASKPLVLGGLLSLAVVAFLGALNLNYPFVADQVIAHLGGRTVTEGGKLYVHFWDNKLPGLFWFHALAGLTFGFSELGVHSLELLWMLIFSGLIIVLLKDWFSVRWLSAFAPIAVVGVYYAAANPFQLTQLEALVGLPIFLAAWSCRSAVEGRTPLALGFFLSGVLAGVTVVFKIVFAPLFVLFWLIAMGYSRARGALAWRVLFVRCFGAAALGTGLVLGVVMVYFWSRGTLDELYWTAFIYPPAALKAAPTAGLLRLAGSAMYFSSYYLPWLFLAMAAVWHWWRCERDLFVSLLIAWFVAGTGLILIQKFSWWPYHFLILFPPAGLLGVRGCDVIARTVAGRGRQNAGLASALALALVLAPSAGLGVPLEQKLQAHILVFVRGKQDAAEFRRYVDPTYAQIEKSVRFLSTDQAREGPIYVFGNPLYYHLSGRRPALPIVGWPWEYFLQSQWVHLPRQLDRVRPPYVYIDNKDFDFMTKRGGGVVEFISEYYVRLKADGQGTWYQLRREKWLDDADAA